MVLFNQPEHIPKAVQRQAEFFLFFARTVFPLPEHSRDHLATVYTPENGRPAWDPVRLLGVLVLQFVLRVPDRQAAELVQYDQRWRLALRLVSDDANQCQHQCQLTPMPVTYQPALLKLLGVVVNSVFGIVVVNGPPSGCFGIFSIIPQLLRIGEQLDRFSRVRPLHPRIALV